MGAPGTKAASRAAHNLEDQDREDDETPVGACMLEDESDSEDDGLVDSIGVTSETEELMDS